MPNDYFNNQHTLNKHELAKGSDVENKLDAVETGFDLIPSTADFSSVVTPYVSAIFNGTSEYAVILPDVIAYSDGMVVNAKLDASNTGNTTLNVNDLGSVPLLRPNFGNLSVNDLITNSILECRYNGTAFIMTSGIPGIVTEAEAAATNSANSAGAANISAGVAETEATNSSNSAGAASTSASNADTSAGAANTSAGAANTSAGAANTSKNKAQEWAENPEDVPVEISPDQFSALHWAAKALGANSGLTLGETSITAYRGDRGKIAYDHSQAPHAPVDANNYVHPSYQGDDASIDTGPMIGAVVINDLDFNITTDISGHVVDANAIVSTRNLTAADIGALSVSGIAVNSALLDNLDSTQFLRSDQDDTFQGKLSIVKNTSSPTYSTGQLEIASSDGSDASFSLRRLGISGCQIRHESSAEGLIISGITRTEYAPVQVLGDPTSANHVARKSYVDGATSKASTGYQKLPSGVIIQWGGGLHGDQTTITFPIAFPSACVSVNVNILDEYLDALSYSTTARYFTATNFDLLLRRISSTTVGIDTPKNISWIAIGY